MTDRDFRGTGDEMFTLDIPGHGEITIKDDGDNDSYVTSDHDPDDHAVAGAVRDLVRSARLNLNDELTMQLFTGEAVAGADAGAGVGVDSTSDPTDFGPPPSYKCDLCGLTWPRGTNQTPDAPNDACPQCAGDE